MDNATLEAWPFLRLGRLCLGGWRHAQRADRHDGEHQSRSMKCHVNTRTNTRLLFRHGSHSR
ncbi:hypothetical protein COMA2_210053 [Candidatus Nitrospira nitrificans]|uniref:Uncharacterized protein n=1 Tax=Candidatus Nitrospira nitrificans TaxID=1742973 RepID=A0A0S4LK17_9BACT|nr:hypothetical protein COMA2_210053 [Candidatus Nitrospira nitrificans]